MVQMCSSVNAGIFTNIWCTSLKCTMQLVHRFVCCSIPLLIPFYLSLFVAWRSRYCYYYVYKSRIFVFIGKYASLCFVLFNCLLKWHIRHTPNLYTLHLLAFFISDYWCFPILLWRYISFSEITDSSPMGRYVCLYYMVSPPQKPVPLK